MTAGEQEYDEVVKEYEEEIPAQEDVQEPPVTDFADTVPAEGKPRCITPILLQFKLYLCIKFKELNETHLHIYLYPMSLTSMIGSCRLLCYRTPVEVE